MNIVILGIQGAGKSTQGNLLSTQLNLPYLSTGHIFRTIAKEKTKLGRHVKELVNAGMLIGDDIALEVVQSYLARPEYASGFILDGFPRTLAQAKKIQFKIDKFFYLEISEKEALWRLVMRKNEDERNDSSIQAVQHRIEQFHEHTEPVVEYYRKKKMLVQLDGMQSVKEVNNEILKSLGKQMVKNKVASWQRNHKSILAIVGLAGSGKTDAAMYYRQHNLPIISFSNIINEYVDSHKLEHDEKTHKRLRTEFRKKYGMEAMAVLSQKKIEKELKKSDIVIVEGMYSWEEYIYLKDHFPTVKVYILAVHADKHIRWGRAQKRTYRKGLYGEQRDIDELLLTNKGPAIAFADFLVKNNFSRDEFHDKLEEVLRIVTFSS